MKGRLHIEMTFLIYDNIVVSARRLRHKLAVLQSPKAYALISILFLINLHLV